MQLSHNLKYEYNAALAKMFERAMPFMSGRVWLHFLDQGMVGRLKQEQRKILLELNRLQNKISIEQEIKKTYKLLIIILVFAGCLFILDDIIKFGYTALQRCIIK